MCGPVGIDLEYAEVNLISRNGRLHFHGKFILCGRLQTEILGKEIVIFRIGIFQFKRLFPLSRCGGCGFQWMKFQFFVKVCPQFLFQSKSVRSQFK